MGKLCFNLFNLYLILNYLVSYFYQDGLTHFNIKPFKHEINIYASSHNYVLNQVLFIKPLLNP